MSTPSLLDVPTITADMARELALAQKVCVRPLLRRVHDRQAGTEDVVALPCGSTREAVCPPCAHKARLLRMQQCAEGWHRTDEPEHQPAQQLDDDQADDDVDDGPGRRARVSGGCGRPGGGRTPPTCPGWRRRTGPSAGCSPPRTAGSTGRACSSP